jgi:O-antigen ligase
MMFALSSVVLAAAIVMGGGSKAGFLGDVAVQLLAIPLLLACLWRWLGQSDDQAPQRRSAERPLYLIAFLGLVLLFVQLTPLPPIFGSNWLWVHALPFQAQDAATEAPWRRLTLTPTASWAAVASVLPPLALFAGVTQLDAAPRFRLAAIVIGLSAVSLLLGFLQIAQGPQSGLRFFEFTNPAEAVGFFANRNHFAAQLYTALVFAAVWFSFAARDFVRQGTLDTRAILWFAAAAVLLIASIAGLALARSRAGLFLALAAIAGIVAMFFASSRQSSRGGSSSSRFVGRMALAALLIAVLFAVQFGLHRVQTRFEADPLADLRFTLSAATFRAALESLPFGTGIGSFVSVYLIKENPQDLFSGYANRAHNDWAELLLETGVFGVAIAVLFLWWFAAKAVAIWRPRPAEELDHHLMLQRAATVVVVLLLAHSAVDYPLRTTAMVTIFAFACAVLVSPPHPATAAEPPPRRGSKRRRSRPAPPPEGAPQADWGADVDWPEAWKSRST